MSEFTDSIVINAPRHDVWAELSDLGSTYVWNPGVEKSHWKGEQRGGVGSERHCSFKVGSVEERAVEWDDLERLKIQIHEHTKMPFNMAHADFRLSDVEGGTRIDLHYEYDLKYGPVGPIADKLFINKMMRKGLGGMLRGLKRHMEQASV